MPSSFIFRLCRGVSLKIFVYSLRGIWKIIHRFYERLDEDWPAKAAMTH